MLDLLATNAPPLIHRIPTFVLTGRTSELTSVLTSPPPLGVEHRCEVCDDFPLRRVGSGLVIKTHRPWELNTPLRELELSPPWGVVAPPLRDL